MSMSHYRVPKGEACQTGKIRVKDLPEPYKLIDATGFEYFDVVEVDLDKREILIAIRNEIGDIVSSKMLYIKHGLKFIPTRMLSHGNQGSNQGVQEGSSEPVDGESVKPSDSPGGAEEAAS
jgi:hypothetical protein